MERFAPLPGPAGRGKSLTAAAGIVDEQGQAESGLVREESEVEAERLALTEETDRTGRRQGGAVRPVEQGRPRRPARATLHGRGRARWPSGPRRPGPRWRIRARGAGATAARLPTWADGCPSWTPRPRPAQQAWQQLDSQHDELRATWWPRGSAWTGRPPTAAGALTRVARLESEIEAAAAKRDDLGNRLAAVGQQDGHCGADAERAAGEQSDAAQRLERLRERAAGAGRPPVRGPGAGGRRSSRSVSRGEIELDTLREESHRRRSRLQSLSEIQSRYESFQRGVRAIMKQYREGITSLANADGASHTDGRDTVGPVRPWSDGAVKGLVADIVQPPPELETAVEAVLGDRLGNIIVESHEVGIDAIDFLKSRSEGRSSFIPLTLGAPASQRAAGNRGG